VHLLTHYTTWLQIPEFFYQPEFLTNSNDFVFGVRNGVEIKNDVELPPWASTSEEFVRLNREALGMYLET